MHFFVIQSQQGQKWVAVNWTTNRTWHANAQLHKQGVYTHTYIYVSVCACVRVRICMYINVFFWNKIKYTYIYIYQSVYVYKHDTVMITGDAHI